MIIKIPNLPGNVMPPRTRYGDKKTVVFTVEGGEIVFDYEHFDRICCEHVGQKLVRESRK